MNQIIQINIHVWAALTTILCFALSMLGIYWLGTTADDREATRVYRKRVRYMEAKQPRVIR